MQSSNHIHISQWYDCYNLALLVEAFIGVVVNKEDRLEHEGMKKGVGWLNEGINPQWTPQLKRVRQGVGRRGVETQSC